MYCVNGNSSWYIICRPLFGGCPLLGVSVIGGSTVYAHARDTVYCDCEVGRWRSVSLSLLLRLTLSQFRLH